MNNENTSKNLRFNKKEKETYILGSHYFVQKFHISTTDMLPLK